MNEMQITLKDWHVIAMVSSMVAMVFKDQIQAFLSSLLTISEDGFRLGETIEVQNSASGDWDKLRLQRFVVAIPFLRGGGVVVERMDGDKPIRREKIGTSVYGGLRKRAILKD